MTMTLTRKEKLLRRHRQKKRLLLALCLFIALVIALIIALIPGFCASAVWTGWAIWAVCAPLCFLLFVWLAHEAWFSDHLFYAPNTDYHYRFDAHVKEIPIELRDGCLLLADRSTTGADIDTLRDDDTLLLEITLRAHWSGYLFDPAALIIPLGVKEGGKEIAKETVQETDCQSFERGASGVRYLNLTGLAKTLREGSIRLTGKHCRITALRLLGSHQPDYRQKRMLIVAPHADDAEIAAFGLYSQSREAWIVTLTAGETEAEHYQRMGFSSDEAARIKGRLRAWDSLAVPLWAGVPPERSLQLGYFCMRLAAMRAEPEKAFASKVAHLGDTRVFRAFNQTRLASDENGIPNWQNLQSDLREIILRARPEVIVLPHPRIDPHPDHVAAYAATLEALQGLSWQPQTLLLYANHLHDNDRWPMGAAHSGVALPPVFEDFEETTDLPSFYTPYSFYLTPNCQRDKAMSLAMMHDLASPLPFKKRLRRALQELLAGRVHPPYGDNEFFRKAVRRHEIFFRLALAPNSTSDASRSES